MDESTKHPHTPEGIGHETTDVNIWAIGKFGVALVAITLLSIGLLIGVFQFFQTRENREGRAFDPVKVFPAPQLLPNEPKALAASRANEETVLNGYAWVDPDKRLVRIPVLQAIELLAKRGLPVRPTVTQGSAVSMPTESGLGVPVGKPEEEAKK